MARCGWCNQRGLEVTSEGTLEVHFMAWAKKTCKGQDNPSLILVRHRAEISHNHGERSDSGSRTRKERIDKTSEGRAKAIRKYRSPINHVTITRNRTSN